MKHQTSGQMLVRTFAAVLVAALVSGCGSLPRQDSVVTVEVSKVFGPEGANALSPLPGERAAFRSAGVTDGELAAGRVVRVHCAVMSDGWWDAIAVLPAGVQARKGTTLRVRVLDTGSNDQLGVSALVELPHQLPPGGQAFRAVPNWRELGRKDNFERVKLPPELQDKYLIVQGWYLLKCKL